MLYSFAFTANDWCCHNISTAILYGVPLCLECFKALYYATKWLPIEQSQYSCHLLQVMLVYTNAEYARYIPR